jgi:hypothetical protein
MDEAEALVHKHFEYRGYSNIAYEPDGNIPPDFLIDGEIAVEVRRLNQNYFDGPNAQGLEEVAIPLWKKVEKLARSMGPPIDGESWYLFIRFSRPVEDWTTLGPKIAASLKRFQASTSREKGAIASGQGFELDVFRADGPKETMFRMGGSSDEESGGWLLSELETNIRHCASEKTRKIAIHQHKYPTWWLALVDHIGYGLGHFDRELFRDQVSIAHAWGKIIVIDPRDHTRYFEI